MEGCLAPSHQVIDIDSLEVFSWLVPSLKTKLGTHACIKLPASVQKLAAGPNQCRSG